MKNPNSYYVSRHEDFRDAVEIVTASGHNDAAYQAYVVYGMDGVLHVIRNGDIRVVDVDDDYQQTGEELL